MTMLLSYKSTNDRIQLLCITVDKIKYQDHFRLLGHIHSTVVEAFVGASLRYS